MKTVEQILREWDVVNNHVRSYLEWVKARQDMRNFFQGKDWNPTQAQKLAWKKIEENGIMTPHTEQEE